MCLFLYAGKAARGRISRCARKKKGRRYTNEEVQKGRRRTSMQTVEVKWDDINKLDLWMLQNMGEDGYLFEVNDGRIGNILISGASPV